MAYLELLSNREKVRNTTKIMIFTEGTILGPQNIFQHFNHKAYKPIGNCVNIIKSWEEQGAEIIYVTSRKRLKQVYDIRDILLHSNLLGDYLYYREQKQKYKDIVELVIPDVLIEDDCRSIGGEWQMCITNVRQEIKIKVKSIAVKEFKGIDNLPLLLSDLLEFAGSK